MRSQVIVRLPVDDEPASWIRRDENGKANAVNRGSLEEAAAQSLGAEVIVLVPSEDVFITQTQMPTANRQRIMKALPFALEDQLVENIEDLHFAIGERDAQGNVPAAVVSRKRMDEWRAQLKRANLMADKYVPDCLVLPFSEDAWTLLRDGKRYLFRANRGDADAFPEDELELNAGFIEKEAEEKEISQLNFYHDDGREESGLPLNSLIEINLHACQNGLLGMVGEHGISVQGQINLLQGDYSRREQWGKYWRPWRLAASLALVWFVMELGMGMAENAKLRAQDDALHEQIVQIYKDTFPDARKVPNPKVQMEQQLTRLREGGAGDEHTFLELLIAAGPPFRNAAGVELRSVRFKNGTLDVELEAPSLQALDKLKQQLANQAKMEVEIQSAASKDNKVQGRLQIKRSVS